MCEQHSARTCEPSRPSDPNANVARLARDHGGNRRRSVGHAGRELRLDAQSGPCEYRTPTRMWAVWVVPTALFMRNAGSPLHPTRFRLSHPLAAGV